MKRISVWLSCLAFGLIGGSTSAFAACSGEATLLAVPLSTTTNPVASSGDYLFLETVPVVNVSFSVTASAGHCGYTCAGIADTDYPTSSTFGATDSRFISSTNSAPDREEGLYYPGTIPARGTLYQNVAMTGGQTCTCQETISGSVIYFYKVCAY